MSTGRKSVKTRAAKPAPEPRVVERVQTGLRIEKRMLKVLKAIAEYHDIGLGDLIEGIVLHALDGKCAFTPESLKLIAHIKAAYRFDLDASHAHRLVESA